MSDKPSRIPRVSEVKARLNGSFRVIAYTTVIGAVAVVATIYALQPTGPHVFSILAGCIGLAAGVPLGYMAGQTKETQK